LTLILDAGALLAIERDDRAMWRRLKGELLSGRPPLTHGGVVAQAWRGGAPRQARLAQALQGTEVAALDDRLGRQAGTLVGGTGTSDVVDAAVVALAADDDVIVTSDPEDLHRLVEVWGRRIDIVPA
jgi:hypothetical protein